MGCGASKTEPVPVVVPKSIKKKETAGKQSKTQKPVAPAIQIEAPPLPQIQVTQDKTETNTLAEVPLVRAVSTQFEKSERATKVLIAKIGGKIWEDIDVARISVRVGIENFARPGTIMQQAVNDELEPWDVKLLVNLFVCYITSKGIKHAIGKSQGIIEKCEREVNDYKVTVLACPDTGSI